LTADKLPPQADAAQADVRSATERQFSALYAELRALARRQLQRNAGAPISATTLVHEAYLNMSGKDAAFPDRARFMGYAARVMRGLIIDMFRERSAIKRGAEFHITLLPTNVESTNADERELSNLSDALDELAKYDPDLAELVDLKYFCGFTFEDVAVQRGVSTRTVQRDWEKARIVLFQFLKSVPEG
jgi:RNA polymerase sigma factor (TIGR02999 family)